MKLDLKADYFSSYYIAGLLSLPLIIQTFPYIGWVFFASIVFLIPFVILKKDSICKSFNETLIIIIFLVVSTFLFALITDAKSISIEVLKDLFRGIAFFLVAIILVLLNKDRSEFLKKIIQISRTIILTAGFIGAILGLFKFFMIKFEHKISILNNSLGEYPLGTSLVTDYNFYALSLLITLLIAIRFWINSDDTKKALFYGCIFSVVINAGIFAGSRRFLASAAPVLLILLFTVFIKENESFKKLKWKELFSTLLITTVLIHGGLYLSDSECQRGKLGCSGLNGISQLEHRVESLIKPSIQTVSPRVERWFYAFEIIKPSQLLLGSGFSYRKEFGCKFNDCKIDDYPHAPILSALLYGGVIGFLSTLACFFYALVTAYQILTRHSSHADLALGLIATTIFVFISGDSLLSMPVFLSMLLISRCVVSFK